MSNISLLYYSGTGMTKKLVESMGMELGAKEVRDLLRNPLKEELAFKAGSLAVVGVPVYSGRVAPPAASALRKLKGQGAYAVAVVTYGNRAYDDALLELKDILEECGFSVVGAGAFVARHAVFPRYAVDRPDQDDLAVAGQLALNSMKKLESCLENVKDGREASGHCAKGALEVKGKRPYMKPMEMPLYPTPDKNCRKCGACARVCPTGAIPKDKPNGPPGKGCISCAACIHACPHNVRAFRSFTYKFFDWLFLFLSKLSFKKSPRKEPEIFL